MQVCHKRYTYYNTWEDTKRATFTDILMTKCIFINTNVMPCDGLERFCVKGRSMVIEGCGYNRGFCF